MTKQSDKSKIFNSFDKLEYGTGVKTWEYTATSEKTWEFLSASPVDCPL